MLDKLQHLEDRFVELERLISDPEVLNRMDEWRNYTKEHSRLKDTVEVFRLYKENNKELTEAREMLEEGAGPEMNRYFKEEIQSLAREKERLEERLKVLLIPQDPNADKNVIMEIRSGAGGEEAALFAGDLFRMYTRYAEGKGWQVEILSASENETGGYKEVIARISGRDVYSYLKFESGAHRVQRVPATESQGRIHTSACTVPVMPEADEVGEVDINPAELRIDTFRSSGAGGQHVNTTDSAIRITHLPTGLVVECQQERSQHKNKAKALAWLATRLKQQAEDQAHKAQADTRRSLVGSGDRSERIRTYNYPQGRVTDHRINLTLYKLDEIIGGDLEEVVSALAQEQQTELLAQMSE